MQLLDRVCKNSLENPAKGPNPVILASAIMDAGGFQGSDIRPPKS